MIHPDPRRKYIQAAAQLIKENGEENVSARKIAALLGTAPSAIYRHFETLDELMVYASISYRYDTYVEIDRMTGNAENALQLYINTETEFARFAFSRPRLLDGLLFGACSRNISQMLQTYREIFPEAEDDRRLYAAAALDGVDFESGNLRLLQMCMDDGSLSIAPDEQELLNGILVHMFKGFLKTALDNPEIQPETLVDRYIRCFIHVLKPYSAKTRTFK